MPIDPAIDNTVALVRLLQSKLDNEQRATLWTQICKGYCVACGKLEVNGMCDCCDDKDVAVFQAILDKELS